MGQVVGVRLRKSWPVIYASTNDTDLRPSNYVALQTEKGQELGWVVCGPGTVVLQQPEESLSAPVVRKATASDFGRWQSKHCHAYPSWPKSWEQA